MGRNLVVEIGNRHLQIGSHVQVGRLGIALGLFAKVRQAVRSTYSGATGNRCRVEGEENRQDTVSSDRSWFLSLGLGYA